MAPDETTDVRVFLSFDVDHDTDLGDRLFEQSLAPESGFHVVSRSNAEEMTDGWRDGVRQRVRDADEVIVICSEHTAASERVSLELRIAQLERKPCLLLWGRRGRMCSMPLGVAQDACMYTWTWETLVHQVAQTLRDAAWRSQRSREMADAESATSGLVSSSTDLLARATSIAFERGTDASVQHSGLGSAPARSRAARWL